MDKHIVATFARDKAIAFGTIEPFHGSDFTITHSFSSFQKSLTFFEKNAK